MKRVRTISGQHLQPKSVVASSKGQVVAQNMMYRHTISLYNAEGELISNISDAVKLDDFGITGHPGISRGAPVEAAFVSDGSKAYISNYSMFGRGFAGEARDDCTPSPNNSKSFVYRLDLASQKIDAVIPVGSVPKYVALTRDNTKLLVTNWCSWDLSVISIPDHRELATIKIGRYPRGIAVSPDSKTAYVAVMGGNEIMRVDLATLTTSLLTKTDSGPRHLVISPDGSRLYSTNNGSGTVTAFDTATGKQVGRVSVGTQPRTMEISPDGTALYVVEYRSNKLVKLDAASLTKIFEIGTAKEPIGVTYEPTKKRIWVAIYLGSIEIFDDNVLR